jgi:hypothetical protein
MWDPHHGKISQVQFEILKKDSSDFTRFSIELEPVSSVFYVSND